MRRSIGLPSVVALFSSSVLQLVEALDEEQVGDLLDDLERIGDPARPEVVPDAVDLVAQFACQHPLPRGPNAGAGSIPPPLAGEGGRAKRDGWGLAQRLAGRVDYPIESTSGGRWPHNLTFCGVFDCTRVERFTRPPTRPPLAAALPASGGGDGPFAQATNAR